MNDLTKAINILKSKIPDLEAVYTFGSTGTPYERPESDLDIAFMTSTHLEPLQKWELAQEIASSIRRDVDIVDIKEASTVFRFEILSSGKRIFCKNHTKCDLFETTSYSEYVRFNDERQALLDDIKKRGKIFNG